MPSQGGPPPHLGSLSWARKEGEKPPSAAAEAQGAAGRARLTSTPHQQQGPFDRRSVGWDLHPGEHDEPLLTGHAAVLSRIRLGAVISWAWI